MSVVETPSKVAAAALSTIDLNASKPAETNLLAKLKAAAAAAQDAGVKDVVVADKKEEDVEEYRKRFVGDVNCKEEDEPLLQETNARFVLFPIKYREVSSLKAVAITSSADIRSGRCTSRPRPRSGRPRRSTWPRTCTTGRTSSTTTSDTLSSTSLPSSPL